MNSMKNMSIRKKSLSVKTSTYDMYINAIYTMTLNFHTLTSIAITIAVINKNKNCFRYHVSHKIQPDSPIIFIDSFSLVSFSKTSSYIGRCELVLCLPYTLTFVKMPAEYMKLSTSNSGIISVSANRKLFLS